MKSVPRIDPIFHCSTTQVFRVEMLDRAFHVILDFEHVSGKLFMVHIIKSYTYQIDSFKTDPERHSVTQGEFRIGEDGKVKALGVLLKPEMGEEKIWFKKLAV